MIKCTFVDNQSVGVDDLNGIVTSFVGKGVELPIENEGPFNISTLNGICYANLERGGLLPDSDTSLLVSVFENIASVEPGNCFFSNGVKAEIIDTETIALTEQGTNYIALCFEKSLNKCTLVALSDEPKDSELNQKYYVLLASVTDGIVTDLRKYAKGKVASSYASDYGLAGMKEVVLTAEDEEIRFKLDYEPNFLIVLPMSLSETDDETITVIDMKADVGLSFYYDEAAPLSYNDSRGEAASISNFKLNTYMTGGGPEYLDGKLTKVEDEYVLTVSISTTSEYEKKQILPCRRRFLFI